MEAAEVARLLGLEPLPDEGGRFRRTVYTEAFSTIYYLLGGDDFSALHALDATEVYHFYDGDPLRLLLLHPDGRIEHPVLGRDLAGGQRPQLVVPPGVWQGSASTGAWTLMGTTVVPPFGWAGFRLGEREALCAAYPDAAARITELTRARPS